VSPIPEHGRALEQFATGFSPKQPSSAAAGWRARVAVTALKMARDQVRLAETENRAKKKLVSM
jgi:hypothetical protein